MAQTHAPASKALLCKALTEHQAAGLNYKGKHPRKPDRGTRCPTTLLFPVEDFVCFFVSPEQGTVVES